MFLQINLRFPVFSWSTFKVKQLPTCGTLEVVGLSPYNVLGGSLNNTARCLNKE